MNSTLLYNLARFILLLAAQVLIFNNINLFGYINPYPYLLFVMLFPVNGNKYSILIASFLLGYAMGLFTNSGGVHAAACVLLAFLRPYIFRFSFGVSYEYQTVKINDVLTPERFSFIFVSVIVHHFCLFLLEVFSYNSIWDVLLRTLLTTLFTVITSILIIYLIKPSKR